MFPTLAATGSADLIPAWLDALAVLVGSFSGVLVARERRLDVVGYVALSILGGLGGGLVRDTMMQCGDVYMLSSPYAIPMSVAAGIVGLIFSDTLVRHPNLFEWVDIVSVGLFVVAGADKAIRYGLGPWAVVLMGTLTGVGGGMMRDVFLGDIPRIFRQSNLYAICAVAGSAGYLLLVSILGVGRPFAALACVVVVVGLRRLSLRFNLVSPAEEDIAPRVRSGASELARRAQARGTGESQRYLDRFGRDQHGKRPEETDETDGTPRRQ